MSFCVHTLNINDIILILHGTLCLPQSSAGYSAAQQQSACGSNSQSVNCSSRSTSTTNKRPGSSAYCRTRSCSCHTIIIGTVDFAIKGAPGSIAA
ncbi:Uncharacterised protein [Klebsiella variicola]|nr:Uncharacterised protein [Klebsiella variicola]VAR93287.1 Uncharacterised protein [Klebsiella variicola]